MHFLLIGPGALGCLLSSVIAAGISDTVDRLTIVDHDPERAALINRRGIIYQQSETRRTIPVQVISDTREIEAADVVFLCLKSYSLKKALAHYQPLFTPATLVIFLQNGIAHLNSQGLLDKATAAFGTTTEGATLCAPGHVLHAGRGSTFLGFLAETSPEMQEKLQRTVDILAAGGLDVSIVHDMRDRLWAKLLVNVGINALTAILNCKNGELLSNVSALTRMHNAVAEAIRVAQAETITIPDKPFDLVQQVCRKTANNVSSMLQDVRAKRRTEIAAINGAIVALGRRLGLKTPENDRLCLEIEEIEQRYRTS